MTFIPKWMKNPSFDERHDRRGFISSPLWDYCCERFRDFWRGEQKAVPINYREGGDEGWFFPRLWVDDFGDLPDLSRQVTTAIPKRYTRKIDAGGGFPDQAELKRWELPAGTQIVAADATIHYPNGAVETWGECRRRREHREAAE